MQTQLPSLLAPSAHVPCDEHVVAPPSQATEQSELAKPASHVHSVPLSAASQFVDAPCPEHASSRVREQLYEQSADAKPGSHAQSVMPLPSAVQSVALPWPEQHSTSHDGPAKPASHAHSVPSPAASQFADSPWPEHFASRVREARTADASMGRRLRRCDDARDGVLMVF